MGEVDQISPILNVQFLVDIGSMSLGGARAYAEPSCNLSAGASLYRELEHLSLARGQRIEIEVLAIGFSLELFNRDYWKQDPQTVARTGLEKMRAIVRSAFAA